MVNATLKIETEIADAGRSELLHRLSIESLTEVPMCALDRRERPLNSQSVNKYILNVQNIYRNSPVPVCVRNKTGKSFMPMGLLLNSFPEKINPYPERVIYVCRLKFFFHHLNWNARLLDMALHFVVVLIFMAKSIR